MFKSARWRGAGKAKAVFKLQFHATQVPELGWESMTVVVTPQDAGRPTARTERAEVTDGACRWPAPIFEATKLPSGKPAAGDKIYQFLVYETGSSKAALLGEATVNMAEYAEAFKPSAVTLPLKGSPAPGALLHVTIQRVVGGAGGGCGDDGSENGDAAKSSPRRTLQSQLSRCEDEEAEKARSLAADSMSPVHDGLVISKPPGMRFPLRRNMPASVEPAGHLHNANGFDAVSLSGSDGSSGRFTPKTSANMHSTFLQDATNVLSPFANNAPSRNPLSSGDWSGSSALDASTDGSTSNSGETGLRGAEDDVEKLRSEIGTLTRKLDVSDMELQTLRKQIVKEPLPPIQSPVESAAHVSGRRRIPTTQATLSRRRSSSSSWSAARAVAMAAAAGRRLLQQQQQQAEAPPHVSRHQQQAAAAPPSPWSAGYLNTWLSQRTPVFGLRLWVLMGIAVGAAIVLVLLLLFLCLSRRRRRRDGHENLYHPADSKPLKQQQHAPTPAKDIQEIVRRQQQQQQQAAPTPLPQPAAVHMAKAAPPAAAQTLQQQRAQLPAMPAGSKRSTAASGLSATTSGGSERDLATPRSAGSGAMGPEVSHLGWGHWFTLRELEEATDGLAEENVIGEGGYGIVYRGTLQDSTIIAVKNLLNNRGQAEKEFKVEVETIGRVRHKNLVRLLGYCVEGAYRMLVYEYVDNGNLDQWLHGEIGEESPLTWDMRMNIIIGTAKGLAYLHEGLEPKVVHRDVKSSNILIDKQFNAKVSDFGLAKLLCSEESYVTTRVMGTFGYVAPEYASTGMLTERSDVYSFGVLLMEIITGRSPVDYTRSAGEVNLIEWLKNMVAERKAEEVVDPKLPERPSPKALKRALLVALRCVDPDGHKRPKMGHVIHMLEMEDLNPRDDRKPRRDAAADRSSSMEDGSLSKRENQRYR